MVRNNGMFITAQLSPPSLAKLLRLYATCAGSRFISWRMQHVCVCLCVCVRASGSCIRKHADELPLAGIAPEQARAAQRAGGVDPGGLGRLLRLRLDVRVDLRGRGRQFGARHGFTAASGARHPPLHPPPAVRAPARAGFLKKYIFLFISSCAHRMLALSDRLRRKRAFPVLSGAARRRRESVSLPVASRLLQTH